MTASPQHLELAAWEWPDIVAGDDLGALACGCPDLHDGDVLVVTSKVVSKAEGRVGSGTRAELIADETVRVVARRGETVIAQTRHGLVMAAAGVDASNVSAGQVLALPTDPDGSARRIREAVWEGRGLNVAVVVSDTAGRAWRLGQTDIAVGCAGIPALVDLSGRQDAYGNRLEVTMPALADEVASSADLVKGKSSQRPLAVVRGLAALVTPPGTHGPGAASLVRTEGDMFALGSRDAVIAAVEHRAAAAQGFPRLLPADRPPFAALASGRSSVRLRVDRLDTPTAATTGWLVRIEVPDESSPADWVEVGRLEAQLEMLAVAHGLTTADPPPDVLAPAGAQPDGATDTDVVGPASSVGRTHWFVA